MGKNIYLRSKSRRMLTICTTIIFIISIATSIIAEANADVPQFDISIVTNPQRQSFEKGTDIVVSGTIEPHDFVGEIKDKEVVLVLDTSGSMQGNKINELKKSALTFIDKMKYVKNLKIGIVTFNSEARILSGFTNDFNDLKTKVEQLRAGGGTNIGGGLRQATYLLSNSVNTNADKYVVFMTDGQPTDIYVKDCARDKRDKFDDSDYYTDIEQEKNGIRKGGIYYKYPFQYSKLIAEKIRKKGYNVFTIGYDLENSRQTDESIQKLFPMVKKEELAKASLQSIHNSMTDKEKNFFESSIGSLDKIFSEIADKIAYSATDVKLNLDFPEGIKIIGGNETIPLKNIIYTEKSRNGNKVTYHAEPITFDFIVRGNKVGHFNLLQNAKITFMWDGKIKERLLNNLNVTITDSKIPKVIMKAKDSAKTITYDSSIKQNNNDENYKLYGKSNIQIEVADVDATYLRYKFIKYGEESDKKDWKYIELNSENDIDKTKENYLTQMPYDVSDMPLRANEEMWNNRNEVFKNSFLDKITEISTQVSGGRDYVKEENIRKDGQIITRWAPRTLFLENYDVSSYAPNYKEASKTWGYMTVPKDGEYTFKAVTDDGFYGNIAVDGECKVIGDGFRVKWIYDQPPASEPIKLKAGEYYPVYFEYFNWGGAACYKIECSTTGDKDGAYKEVGAFGIKFYPSKSHSPKDNSNNGFMGSKTIDMPTEFGKYTFEYELVKDLNYGTTAPINYEKKGEGKFGTFEVEKRFDLNKYFSKNGKEIGNELEIEKNNIFEITYEVIPKEIKLEELYKGEKSYIAPDSIYVKHVSIEDELPQGLFNRIIVKENGREKEEITNKVNFNKDSLEYKLNRDKYIAEPYTFTVNVECTPDVSKVVSFEKRWEVNYRDVSLNDNLRISQTQYFDDNLTLKIIGESQIIKHGIVDGNKIKSLDEMKSEIGHDMVLSSNMNYTLGFIVNAQGNDNNFTIKTNDAEITNVFIYELDSNDKININTKKQVDNIERIGQEGNGLGNNITQGKKYAIVYSAKVNTNKTYAEFIAKLDTGSEKHLRLNLNQELPDLF